jgi:hypothetical protein
VGQSHKAGQCNPQARRSFCLFQASELGCDYPPLASSIGYEVVAMGIVQQVPGTLLGQRLIDLVGNHGDLLSFVRSSVLITAKSRMPVTRDSRNRLCCYSGCMPATLDLVRPAVCADPAGLIVAFLNTLDVEEGTDTIDTLVGWTSWLASQGLEGCFEPRDAGDIRRAHDLRADLRALVGGEQHSQGHKVDIQVALTSDGRVKLCAQTATGFLAAAAATVAIQERMDRIKICPADSCRWAFYDTSRNRSRQWCSMRVCGNRAKSRAHRRRAAAPE